MCMSRIAESVAYEQTLWEASDVERTRREVPGEVLSEFVDWAGRFFGVDPWEFGFVLH